MHNVDVIRFRLRYENEFYNLLHNVWEKATLILSKIKIRMRITQEMLCFIDNIIKIQVFGKYFRFYSC